MRTLSVVTIQSNILAAAGTGSGRDPRAPGDNPEG
jgi:hypothetical protein